VYDRNRKTLLAVAETCWVCGLPATPNDPLTCDHIQPISNGGSNYLDNLRAAHASCNSRRGRGVQKISNENTVSVPPRRSKSESFRRGFS
jgi:5-methylcytosine-specific restriction endonuclease McrA